MIRMNPEDRYRMRKNRYMAICWWTVTYYMHFLFYHKKCPHRGFHLGVGISELLHISEVLEGAAPDYYFTLAKYLMVRTIWLV